MFKNKFYTGKKILITGASGFVGRTLVPLFEKTEADIFIPSHKDYDLTQQSDVRGMLETILPDIVIHLAGLIGGLMANKDRPAEFYYQNMISQTMMMHESFKINCEKYVTLMGGCSYPAQAISPIVEEDMWEGYPQGESAPYSSAKKMNIVMSNAYRAQHKYNSIILIPGNIYGPYDNFDLRNSHVIPALIRKYHEAKEREANKVVAWGSGKPVRDFIYIDDAASAIFQATMQYDHSDVINISSGVPVAIKELTQRIADIVGFDGEIEWDKTKPDGQIKKVFSVDKMRNILGFEPKIDLDEGLKRTYDWFRENYDNARLDY
jgi:GDP-L-fucose synthase